MPTISNSTLKSLRILASQSGFAKKIFSQGAQGLSAAQVSMELRQLLVLAGVDLPKEILVTLDTAQAILAGGTFVSDINTGEAALQCVGDASNFLSAGLAILSDLGIGGEVTKQLADAAALGSNVALAISSCGANVLADIGAIISLINVVGDLGRDFFGSHDAAVMDAKQKLRDALNSQVTAFLDPQLKFASQAASDYQAGALNYFDFVGGIALNSPVSFKRFFPGLACYFPSWIQINISASATGVSSGLFGNQTDTESQTVSFMQLLTNKTQVQSVLFNYYIGTPLSCFESFFSISPGISLRALSCLSMILSTGTKGDVKIDQNFDLIAALKALSITPGILGDTYLFKGLDKNELETDQWKNVLPYTPYTLPKPQYAGGSGIVINGYESLTPKEVCDRKYQTDLKNLQCYMQYLDSIGDIDSLLKIPEAVAILNSWATFHPRHILGMSANDPFDHFRTSSQPVNGIRRPNSMVDVRMPDVFQDGNTIDISDYWRGLGMAKQMLASNLFQDQNVAIRSLGNLDEIETLTKRVHSFIIAKNMNMMGRLNVAKYMGIAPNQLGSRLTKNNTRIFYRKAG